jgi:saposin
MKDDEAEPDTCTKCYTIVKHMENKLQNTSHQKMLEQFLRSCGQFGSYSDSCANIILNNFDVIYDLMQNNFNAINICHLSGQCANKYHKHEDDVDIVSVMSIIF